ncbi:MAG: hypothetical protein DRP71_06850 [Verrucomicrobia bacterium]|nr:MAG: hypothetical protein DRP71_06850 [Verrucomicrobiota bacterium]
MHRLLRSFLLISVGSLAAFSGLFGGVEIIVQVNTESKANTGGVEVDPPSTELYTLRIQDTWVEVDGGELAMIMDRGGDRMVTLDKVNREYDSTSLFALFEFRAGAYEKVLAIDSFGYRPGSYGTAEPEVLADHIFSITNPDSVQKPESLDTGNERQWMSGDQQLAQWSLAGAELSETHLDNFVFWLRQTGGGHPVILGDLIEGGVLPDDCEIVLNSGRFTRRIGVEVVGLRERPDITLESRLEGYSLRSMGSDTDTLVALLDWVRGGTEFAESLISSGQVNAAASGEAFENGDPIRGILQLIRTQMITGLSPEMELESYGPQIRASRTAANLLTSLNARGGEQSERAIQTFDVLSDAFEDQAPVLNILSAENLARTGRLDLAEGLYRKAILSDPGLAVAYKEIGDIYRSTGRFPMGWMCYDAFEIVAPNHPGMKMVREMKQVLVEDFPGFF